MVLATENHVQGQFVTPLWVGVGPKIVVRELFGAASTTPNSEFQILGAENRVW